MPAQPSSTAGRIPVDFVYSGLGGTEPESVEAEGGDRAVRTGLEYGIRLSRVGGAPRQEGSRAPVHSMNPQPLCRQERSNERLTSKVA